MLKITLIDMYISEGAGACYIPDGRSYIKIFCTYKRKGFLETNKLMTIQYRIYVDIGII